MKTKEEKIKKLFAFIGTISLLGLVGYQILLVWSFKEKTILNQKDDFQNNQQQNSLNNQEEIKNLTQSFYKTSIKTEPLKEKVDLLVPFISQAPYGLWDKLHNEACEEAVLIMVHYFLKGENLTKEKMEKEIQELVNWQIKNWGEHKDLTIEEVGLMAKKYYGWQKIRILNKITLEEIKKEISNGHPIIVPTAGRLLKNPYYRQPGPYYHMLVIRGYTKEKIITNDPGTRRGEKFSYSPEILYQAIHNWPGKDKDILEGEKIGLIIEK